MKGEGRGEREWRERVARESVIGAILSGEWLIAFKRYFWRYILVSIKVFLLKSTLAYRRIIRNKKNLILIKILLKFFIVFVFSKI